LNRSNRVISTGRRINDLSDDPVGLTQSLEIKATLSNIDQLGRNISFGKSWLTAAEGTLGNVQDLLSDAKALCVGMASASKSTANRLMAAETIAQSMKEVITLANTKVGGKYIFGGSDTDSIPFDEDGSYNGNDIPFAVKAGNSTLIEVGSDGGALFSNIFTTLSDLITDLKNDNIQGIRDTMDSLEGHFDDISLKVSDVGLKMNRMEIRENILQGLKITNTERLSQVEDADMAEAVMNLKAVEAAYQAALSSSASVMRLSLVDYLE
jgi:flagellar hook-associated protein 3 FlgL